MKEDVKQAKVTGEEGIRLIKALPVKVQHKLREYCELRESLLVKKLISTPEGPEISKIQGALQELKIIIEQLEYIRKN